MFSECWFLIIKDNDCAIHVSELKYVSFLTTITWHNSKLIWKETWLQPETHQIHCPLT